ncbi:MAG: polysaccharide biosynthesis C-terminal domain-containing protein [Syntrophothermus sp.]
MPRHWTKNDPQLRYLMIKKIIGTLTTRVLIAGITLLVVLLNARVLGAERTGLITQLILAVTIIQLFAGIPGGGSLVYLVPRNSVRALLVPSYIWGVVVSFSGTYILSLFEATRAENLMVHVLFLSLLLTFSTINLMVLMGKEQIRIYNIITFLQAIILLSVLGGLFFIIGNRETISYIIALYCSYGGSFLISLLMILPYLGKAAKKNENQGVLDKLFRYGGTMQAGNILQFLNYRLSYFFVKFFLGQASLGIYSVGNQLAESLWILGKSISMVQYSRISNQDDHVYAARLTLTFVKITFVLTFLAMIVLWVLIFLLFPFILKPEFAPVKYLMLILGPGILTFSVNVVLSPYFSGSGKPRYNTITASVGLAFTLITGLILIPRFGLAGAAMSATISYSCATLYQFLVFIRISGIHAKDFLLRGAEFRSVYRFFVTLPEKNISQ